VSALVLWRCRVKSLLWWLFAFSAVVAFFWVALYSYTSTPLPL
jgi:hypothetical protein